MDNRIHIVAILTTELKVSLQSLPYLCLKPFATNLALYLSMVPINFLFNLVDPLVVNYILSLMCWNQMPGLILHKCKKFFIHGTFLVLVMQGLMQSLGLTCHDQTKRIIPNGSICKDLGLHYVVLEPCVWSSDNGLHGHAQNFYSE
jgi:hypothetical protein